MLAAAGLAAAAVGISVVWPLLIADVNNEAAHPALAIGGVTACGYLGMVAGPPLVGVISGVFGLQTGLLVLAGIALFVAVTPAHVRTRSAVGGLALPSSGNTFANARSQERRARVEHRREIVDRFGLGLRRDVAPRRPVREPERDRDGIRARARRRGLPRA